MAASHAKTFNESTLKHVQRIPPLLVPSLIMGNGLIGGASVVVLVDGFEVVLEVELVVVVGTSPGPREGVRLSPQCCCWRYC